MIEVMCHDCGYLALMAGLAGGTEAIVILEVEFDPEVLATARTALTCGASPCPDGCSRRRLSPATVGNEKSPGCSHTRRSLKRRGCKPVPKSTLISNLHPMKRMGTSEEVSGAVIWSCSDAASFRTGHALMVDGGYTAQ